MWKMSDAEWRRTPSHFLLRAQRKMKLSIVRFLSLMAGTALQAVVPAVGNEAQSVAHIERAHRFLQIKVSTCDELPKVLHFGKSDIRYADGELSISGSMRRGVPIGQSRARTSPDAKSGALISPGAACLILRSDERHDSSGGYDSELSVILFGGDGRPRPWKAIGNFTSDARGIQQVIQTVPELQEVSLSAPSSAWGFSVSGETLGSISTLRNLSRTNAGHRQTSVGNYRGRPYLKPRSIRG